jgi:hypothetical protein
MLGIMDLGYLEARSRDGRTSARTRGGYTTTLEG